jgi:hypothetical protein
MPDPEQIGGRDKAFDGSKQDGALLGIPKSAPSCFITSPLNFQKKRTLYK